MPRLRVPAAILALALGLVLVALGLLAPGPPRVNIRWTPQTTDSLRTEAEQSLHLTGAIQRDGRTWSYLLLDTSRDNVGRVLDHPAVEDRHHFGPGRTLVPEAPPLQAWLQARYGRPPASWIASGWWLAGPALVALALFITWPPLVALLRVDWRLSVVLIVSALGRLWLIASGGQYYWPDEGRYRRAQELVTAIVARDSDQIRLALQEPTSVLLKLVGLVPAGIEHAIGNNPRIPAMVFGACSVMSIWLIAAIARRLDATRDEAFVAALLAAGSASLFYFSRHLVSYDLGIAVGLLGVFTAVNRQSGRTASLLTGVWAVATFLAYAGYWTLAGAVCAIHLADSRSASEAFRRGLLVITGMGMVVAALVLGYRVAGLSWVERLAEFSGKITQGDFGEGWRLPFEYLWHAEHLLLVGWLAAVVWCGWRVRWGLQARLPRAAIVGAASIYAALAISSTVLHRFVVYGRLSRPLILFLCLLTAAVIGFVINRAAGSRRRVVILGVITAAVTAQAAVNVTPALRLQFPSDFITAVERQFPKPVFVNARHLYPGPEPVLIPPGYHEVAVAPHPLQFMPYQYEGYTANERQALRSDDIRMRAFAPRP